VHGATPVQFLLVDGDRRLTAIEKLLKRGHEFPEGVPVVIVDKNQTEVQDLVQMYVANDSKPFSPMEEAIAYQKMKDAGMTIKQICDAVGHKAPHVVEILNLARADDVVKEAAKDGSIGRTQAKQIATHAKGDRAKQIELVAAAKKAGKSAAAKREVKALIDDARRNKNAKVGRVLKIRALTDEQLSAIGASVALHLKKCLAEAKMPLDSDMRAWVKADDKLALAATFGALEALKMAAGAGAEGSLEF
jgi:ParB-like chromosome segregation protein Spo0J